MTRVNLSAWAVRNPALMTFAILLAFAAGLQSYLSLGRAEDPPFTIKTMVVSAAWPGATATEMENLVADPIETRLRSLPFLDHVQGYARAGVVLLNVNLKDSTPAEEVPELFYQVRKKVEDIRAELPSDLRGPFFDDEYSDVYAAIYMITGKGLTQAELLPHVEALRQRMLRVPDIDKAMIVGERDRRIFVEISWRRLASLGITPDVLFTTLRQQNGVVPSGEVDTSTDRVSLRVDGGLTTLESLREVPITANGRTFRLGDIATFTTGYADPPTLLIRHGGVEAMGLAVRMRAGANGLALGEALHAAAAEVQAALPVGVEFHQITDQAEAIDEAVSEFLLKFGIAVAVVLGISLLALGLSAGIIVALSVPLTLAITFVVMEVAGIEFHRISLGALIIALGLLVDDAIIAIEMMLVKMEEGLDRFAAASFAWTSTAFPMLTGTLVTIAGFLPVGFAKSTAGEYAGGIFWVVGIALIVSWVVAVLFTPFLGVQLLPRRLEARAEGTHHDLYDRPVFHRFRRVVGAFIDRRWLVLLALGGALGLAVLAFTQVPKQFFPSSERRELLLELKGPEGASFALTDAAMREAEALLAGRPEVEHQTSFVGEGAPRFFLALNPVLPNPSFGQILILTKGNAERESLRRFLLDHYAAAEGPVRGRVLRLEFGPPTGHPVQFRVTGPDMAEVERIAADVRDVVRQNPETRDVELQWGEEAKAIRVAVDQRQARALGLSSAAIAQTLQTLMAGAPVTELRDGNRMVGIELRATPEERAALDGVGDVTILNEAGRPVPLAQVARIAPSSEPPILWRRNGDVVLSVRADVVDGVQAPDVSNAILPELAPLVSALPPGYAITAGGAIEESGKADRALFTIMPVMLLVMLTLIMLQVRSFGRMILVFITFPLGFVGASLSLWLSGLPFGFVALLGTLALGGIIVRNTLILADQIETDRANGLTMRQAIIETTVRRARPVILTALAAVLAFTPLTLTAFWAPLAVVLIGGTLIGTILTLCVLPALYAAAFSVGREPRADVALGLSGKRHLTVRPDRSPEAH